MTTTGKTLFLLFTFILFVFSSVGQVYNRDIEKEVLAKAIIDSVFVFGKWTEKSQTEIRLKYLGN